MSNINKKLLNDNPQEIYGEKYWRWLSLVNPNIFDDLYEQLNDVCQRGQWRIAGQITREPKRSIIIERLNAIKPAEADSSLNIEPHPTFTWDDYPIIKNLSSEIRCYLEIKDDFDYCLINIYDDGNDGIGFHADEEAGGGAIISVSLGETRSFTLRPKLATNNGGKLNKKTVNNRLIWFNDRATTKIDLQGGDVIYMLPGCQQNYKHSLVKTSKKVGPRINLTYRYHKQPVKK